MAKDRARSGGPIRRRPARAVRQEPPATRYVESSALLAALLEGDAPAGVSLRAGGRRVTSALTLAEAGRAIVRARAAGRLSLEQEQAAVRGLRTLGRRHFIVDVDRAVVARAAHPFPVEPIRTLDAIHLATAAMLDDSPQLVIVVTRHARIRDNARALGFRVE